MEPSGAKVDRLVRLYPKVDEVETALPRSWSGKDKYTYIGLSQNNLRVHYKGKGSVNIVCLSAWPFSYPVEQSYCHMGSSLLQVVARTTRMQHR